MTRRGRASSGSWYDGPGALPGRARGRGGRTHGGPARPRSWKSEKLEESGLGAELAALAERYEAKKRELNAIDYGDMIGLAIRLLED